MRKLVSLTVVMLLIGQAVFGGASAAVADEVFPDPNLKSVIQEILKKKQIKGDEIKEEDLKSIYFLNAQGKDIADLKGLEKCPNLAEVRLARNKIQNLEPLAGLGNIQSLDLSQNEISDIAPLAKLEKLQYLKLDNNQIENIDAVGGLKKLSALYLEKNKIHSIEAVKSLEKLSSLYLDQNAVQDLKPLKDLKWIRNLGLEGNQIEDVSPLAGMTELHFTFLQGNKIKDISPLVEMAKKDAAGEKRFAPYWELYLGKNPLSDDARGQQAETLKQQGVRLHLEDKQAK